MFRRSITNYRYIVILAAATATALLTGCGSRTPDIVANEFFAATNKDDKEALMKCLTVKARETLSSSKDKSAAVSVTNKTGKVKDWSLGHVEIDKERINATVPVTIKPDPSEPKDSKPQRINLKMRMEQDEWRIWGIGVKSDDLKNEFTIDLEHPESIFGEILKQIPSAMENAGKAIGATFQQIGEGLKKAGDSARKEFEKK